jgi:hypothetical protein
MLPKTCDEEELKQVYAAFFGASISGTRIEFPWRLPGVFPIRRSQGGDHHAQSRGQQFKRRCIREDGGIPSHVHARAHTRCRAVTAEHVWIVCLRTSLCGVVAPSLHFVVSDVSTEIMCWQPPCFADEVGSATIDE